MTRRRTGSNLTGENGKPGVSSHRYRPAIAGRFMQPPLRLDGSNLDFPTAANPPKLGRSFLLQQACLISHDKVAVDLLNEV